MAAPVGRRAMAVKAYTDAAPQGKELAFASYQVYKGKAALAIKAIMPTWASTVSKNGNTGWQVDREGVVLFEFANVAGGSGSQSGYGERSYAWDQKITFALKATELAQIVDLDNNPTRTVSMFHDPNKGNETAGQVSKTLKVAPGKDNDGSLMFTLSQTGPNKSNVMVPVTRAEYVVIANIGRYLLPRLLGFDMVVEQDKSFAGTQ